MPTKADRRDHSRQWIFGTMLIFGVIALLASFTLAIDEIAVLKNPHTVLSCSLNIVLNCSTVMQTWQAHVFGFPNMLIGLMAFPIVITVALIGLSGATLPAWFWRATGIGYVLGAGFAYWLFFNSLYAIQVLCPWCLVVTLSTTMILATMTHYVVTRELIRLPGRANDFLQAYVRKDYGKVTVASWFVLLILLVFLKFGISAIFS